MKIVLALVLVACVYVHASPESNDTADGRHRHFHGKIHIESKSTTYGDAEDDSKDGRHRHRHNHGQIHIESKSTTYGDAEDAEEPEDGGFKHCLKHHTRKHCNKKFKSGDAEDGEAEDGGFKGCLKHHSRKFCNERRKSGDDEDDSKDGRHRHRHNHGHIHIESKSTTYGDAEDAEEPEDGGFKHCLKHHSRKHCNQKFKSGDAEDAEAADGRFKHKRCLKHRPAAFCECRKVHTKKYCKNHS